MQEMMRNKLLPVIVLILILGVLMLAVPITASADEPYDDEYDWDLYDDGYDWDSYDGYYDEYYDDYYGDYYEDEWPEDVYAGQLPDEYYSEYMPNPFTPAGTGTVIDNATDGDGKEFYTIETPDGNIFYLIIDKQRSSENVYFLGAVTEEDLMSLAVPGDGKTVLETDETLIPAEIGTEPSTGTTEPITPPAATAEQGSSDIALYIIIGIAVVGIGGAGYYFKIVKPKKDGTGYDDDYGEDYGDDDDFEDDDEDDDDYEDETESDTGGDENDGGFDEDDEYADDGDAAPDSGGDDNISNGNQIHNTANTPPASPTNNNRRRRRRKRRRSDYNGH